MGGRGGGGGRAWEGETGCARARGEDVARVRGDDARVHACTGRKTGCRRARRGLCTDARTPTERATSRRRKRGTRACTGTALHGRHTRAQRRKQGARARGADVARLHGGDAWVHGEGVGRRRMCARKRRGACRRGGGAARVQARTGRTLRRYARARRKRGAGAHGEDVARMHACTAGNNGVHGETDAWVLAGGWRSPHRRDGWQMVPVPSQGCRVGPQGSTRGGVDTPGGGCRRWGGGGDDRRAATRSTHGGR